MSRAAKRPRGRPLRSAEGDESIREQILRVAGDYFARFGYAGTSISMIVNEVEVSAATLYWHFPNKEAVLFSLLVDGMERFGEDIAQEVGDATDPVDVLQRLATGHIRAILGDARVTRIAGFSATQLSQSLEPEHYRTFNELQHQHLSRWRGVIRQGVLEGLFDVEDPTVAACAIIDMCESTRGWFHSSGPLSINELAQQYAEFALRLAGYRAKTESALVTSARRRRSAATVS